MSKWLEEHATGKNQPLHQNLTLQTDKLLQCCIQMLFGTIWTVWMPKKCFQKVLVTLFPYIFHIKTKWSIVYENLKQKSLQEINIFP